MTQPQSDRTGGDGPRLYCPICGINNDSPFPCEHAAPPKPAPDALRDDDGDDFLMQAGKTIGHLTRARDAVAGTAPDALREALVPFATFGIDESGNNIRDGLMRDRICDWFGPSDFIAARAAYNSSAPVPSGEGMKCNCGPMCQDLGMEGGCRYLRPEREELRKLVDATWQHATESKAVPSTDVADSLINNVFAFPSPAVTPKEITDLIWTLRRQVERPGFEMEKYGKLFNRAANTLERLAASLPAEPVTQGRAITDALLFVCDEAACKHDSRFYEAFEMDDRWTIIRAVLEASAISSTLRGGST